MRVSLLFKKIKTKEFIIKTLFVASLLVIFIFFPAQDVFQQNIAILFFFVIIPIMFNKIILKRKLSDFGLRIGDWKQGLIWSGISSVFIAAVFFIASYFFNFLEKYSIPASVVHNYENFILYLCIDVLSLVLIYEFFFRGFIVFAFEKELRYGVVIFQALIFYALISYMIYMGAGSVWSFMIYITLAPFSGVIAYKSRSIFYSIALQFIVFTIINASVVRLVG